ASPLVTTATVCATTPAALSARAAWTHRPAWRIARRAGTATSGMESGGAEPAADGAAGSEGAEEAGGAEEPAGAEEPGGAEAAPTEARAVARSRACCPLAADAARRGRPNAKSPANATTEREEMTSAAIRKSGLTGP